MSTRVCLAVTALRMRVIMSEIGSVISVSLYSHPKTQAQTHPSLRAHPGVGVRGRSGLSPRALRHARDVALERQLAEAQAAHVELPQVPARAAAQVAAVVVADLELERFRFPGDLCGRCHALSL